MLVDSRFWLGVGAGLLALYAFHHFVKPMPTKAG
jgi:hypothetical protein